MGGNLGDRHKSAQANDIIGKPFGNSAIGLQKSTVFNTIPTVGTKDYPVNDPKICSGIKNIQIPYSSLSVRMYGRCRAFAFITDRLISFVRFNGYFDCFVFSVYGLIRNSNSTKAKKRLNIDVGHCLPPLEFCFWPKTLYPEM